MFARAKNSGKCCPSVVGGGVGGLGKSQQQVPASVGSNSTKGEGGVGQVAEKQAGQFVTTAWQEEKGSHALKCRSV